MNIYMIKAIFLECSYKDGCFAEIMRFIHILLFRKTIIVNIVEG